MSIILRLLKQAAGGPPMGSPDMGGDGPGNTPDFAPPVPGGGAPGDDSGADGGGDSASVPLIHSKGGTAVVLTPHQVEQLHNVLTQNGVEPHGVMIILPKEGKSRSVHFEPIPVAALADPSAPEQLLDAWEQAHGDDGGGDADSGPPHGADGDGDADDAGGPPDMGQDATGMPGGPNVPDLPPGAGGGGGSPFPPKKKKGPPAGPPMANPGVPMDAKQSGFMSAFLYDQMKSGSMEKTAEYIFGTGLGMGEAIDKLIKGANRHSLEEMQEVLQQMSRCDTPAKARKERGAV